MDAARLDRIAATVTEMEAECDRAESQGLDSVVLHTDRLPGKGAGMRLFESWGPVGEILCTPSMGGTTLMFPLRGTRAALRKARKALDDLRPGGGE
jgi:hypothetical protein